ncbi:uncharacterized protein PFL1_01732 [Pseudozyma flocculosa PF-1]|uniref:Related to macronuclear actin 1 n=1 Tax=Pseudozyma flocculosa TaxID=84751 RepID=A0A5C3EX34_9BASI|nr:uncharacterized protein PFL1_01732 [Pseudozyma flocculosa PF-1]EPQ30834.1 hypothetical protein PFL1_01732 [Pseudozyma flocculosa PF-1]SPO36794.1 related to macronuclear actin 1 [Pseudozyma flocculosa]
MNVREARTVMVLTGSHTITAGYGIHEIFRRPSVTLTARVGLPRSKADTLMPASASASASTSASHPPDYTQYLVGAALDEAERKGQDLAIFWPMRHGVIRDWQQMIALWSHVLFALLPVKRSANDSYILLSLPAPISRDTHTLLAQVFFQHFNAPALCIVEKPLLAAYGVGTMNATVVDLGWEGCDVTPVFECQVQHNANVKSAVGARHCTLFLAHLLRRDQSIVSALTALLRYKRKSNTSSSSAASTAQGAQGSGGGADDDEDAQLQDALVALARQLVEDGHVLDEDAVRSGASGLTAAGGDGGDDDDGNFDIAAALVEGRDKKTRAAMDEEEERRRAALEAAHADDGLDEAVIASITGDEGQAGASTDEKAVLVQFRGLKLKVGPERFRFLEPLFRPELLEGVRGADEVALGDEPFGAGPFPDFGVARGGRFDGFVAPLAWPDWSRVASLPSCIAQSIASIDELDRRVTLWENLILHGSPAKIKTIQIETISALSDHVASAGTETGQVMGEPNPLQPRNVRALRVPDYFSEFKDRTDLAGFLGATVYAKLVFGDLQAKSYITKQNYNEMGPNAAYSVRPTT